MLRFEAERSQKLEEAFRWYELQLFLLNEEERRLPQLFSSDSVPERYRDKSPADLRAEFALARRHLELVAMLHLLSTSEALLRLAFRDLWKHQRKPAISRQFRRIKRERGKKIRLMEDILDTWIAVYPETARSIREFKGVVPLRDWLAHGRYWTPKNFGRSVYEVRDVFDI